MAQGRMVRDPHRLALRNVIPLARAAIVMGVSGASGLLVLLIERVASSKWLFADAATEFVNVFFSSILIVGLLEWHERSRWQRADWGALSSLALTAHLAATGWSNPQNLPAPTLHPAPVLAELAKAREELREQWTNIDTAYQKLISDSPPDKDSDPGEALVIAALTLQATAVPLELYYLEGSRTRRLQYLEHLVDEDIPRLVDRRSDPKLAGIGIELRDRVASALAGAEHADTIIRERILVERPPILSEYLGAGSAFEVLDPVAMLFRSIKAATDKILRQQSTGAGPGEPYVFGFANRCLGAVRNEVQWVEAALGALSDIISLLREEVDNALMALPTPPVRSLHRDQQGQHQAW